MPLDIVHSACPHDCPSTCALEVERIDAHRIGRVRGAAENRHSVMKKRWKPSSRCLPRSSESSTACCRTSPAPCGGRPDGAYGGWDPQEPHPSRRPVRRRRQRRCGVDCRRRSAQPTPKLEIRPGRPGTGEFSSLSPRATLRINRRKVTAAQWPGETPRVTKGIRALAISPAKPRKPDWTP